jgi:hypothetical protein
MSFIEIPSARRPPGRGSVAAQDDVPAVSQIRAIDHGIATGV